MVFSNLIELSGSYTVDLAIVKPRDVVYKHFAFVCFVCNGAAPIPFVQADILNLPHPELRSTTVLLDIIQVFCGSFSSGFCFFFRVF